MRRRSASPASTAAARLASTLVRRADSWATLALGASSDVATQRSRDARARTTHGAEASSDSPTTVAATVPRPESSNRPKLAWFSGRADTYAGRANRASPAEMTPTAPAKVRHPTGSRTSR